jgi:hypothetical protein
MFPDSVNAISITARITIVKTDNFVFMTLIIG